MPSEFYFVHAAGRAKVAPLTGGALQTFRANAVELRVFDVGAGEALLLSRGNRAVLFDGGAEQGRTNAPLARALVGYLTETNRQLGAIVATHPHIDHLNALAPILAEDDPLALTADAVYYHNDEALPKKLRETLQVRLMALASSGRLQVAPVTTSHAASELPGVELLHFVDGRYKPKPVYKSIWTLAWYGEASFLFTGDAYTAYEEALLASPLAGLLRADVLKITHHGSQGGTGKPFAGHVRPRLAVASTAPDAGHRLEPIVKKHLKPHAKIFDTGRRRGDVIVRTDGLQRTQSAVSGVLYEVVIERPGWYRSQAW
jgi:beta-lactamase superfamily II metal-dependent hydrolase